MALPADKLPDGRQSREELPKHEVLTTGFDLRRFSPADAARLLKIVFTFAGNGLLVVARKGPRIVLRPREQATEAAAQALRRSFTELGPTFVKFGQMIASSPGLFPEPVTSELRQLLDSVKPEPTRIVRATIERDLGAPVDVLFASFDDKPLAAASVAQVHEAYLHDGTRVAVKVQRPNLRGRIERDLRLMRLLANGVALFGSIREMADPVGIVDDFAASLDAELDFRNEAAWMQQFQQNLRIYGHNDLMVVPTPLEGMVSKRVLVMSFVEGIPIDNVEELRGQGHELIDVGLQGVRAWLESALRHGLFHGDVHAGNLFVTPEGEIAFLDFGIMGTLTPETREMLRETVPEALPAIVLQDQYHRVGEILEALGAGNVDPDDHEALAKEMRLMVADELNRPLSEVSYGNLLVRLIQIATRYKLHLPRDLVMVSKQLIYFEGYSKKIAPDMNIFTDPDTIKFLLNGLVSDDMLVQLPFMLAMITPTKS